MAASIEGVFSQDLQNAILQSKVLVVGAGGIGCEILKNLVMSGFPDIEIIDLDTIDVSNLNRQFLFHKKHVGKSKAEVARETALTFNPDVKIKHYHDSITTDNYGLSFFKRFTLVMNALDNRAARNHVNRMCLAADIPLIESGTAGYDGQVELIKKGKTQCYECSPKVAQKTFPGCTIRNTPSEPIHCIVWAKHLFNQLFGEEDPDQDVSPDTADPEAAGETAGENALNSEAKDDGNVQRVSTRTWAQSCSYDPEKLFTKLFCEDIKYLLSMENLWKKRRPPTPLNWSSLPDSVAGCSKSSEDIGLRDQQQWSIAKCGLIFAESVKNLSAAFKACREKNDKDHLVWDKDDQNALNFVASCANIRAHIFGIPEKTKFDIKSMAGNIIPAIATTNAIIAGVVILHAFRILTQNLDSCKSVYLRPKANHRGQLLVPEKCINQPNPKCYVCAEKPTAILAVDTKKMTVKQFEEAVLKSGLNMIAPDTIIEGKGIVVISSEEDETEQNNEKLLEEVGITDGTILSIDDFLQNYSLQVTVIHRDEPTGKSDEPKFIITADSENLKPKEEETKTQESATNGEAKNHVQDEQASSEKTEAGAVKRRGTEPADAATPSKKRKIEELNNVSDSDDDICVVEDNNDVEMQDVNHKKPSVAAEDSDDDCCIIVDENDICVGAQ